MSVSQSSSEEVCNQCGMPVLPARGSADDSLVLSGKTSVGSLLVSHSWPEVPAGIGRTGEAEAVRKMEVVTSLLPLIPSCGLSHLD